MDWAYDKWSKLKISDDGEIEEVIPPSVEQALADSEQSRREAGTSEVLFESWDVSKPNVLYCGFGETAEGLEDALVSMKKGEHAMLTISAEYGFGAHDVAPPCPDLPTDRALHFEVLLLEIGKGYEHWNLDVEGKRTHATRKRVRGNDFFRRQQFRRALKLYQPIVDKMGYFMKMPKRPSDAARAQAKAANELHLKQGQKIHNVASSLEADDKAESEEERALKRELQTPCFLNIAACRSKLGDEKGCIEACNGALKLEEGNIKALYRRATAQIKLCNYNEARADLQLLLEQDAQNADALRELARIHRLEEQARAKQRKAFGGMFKSQPSADGGTEASTSSDTGGKGGGLLANGVDPALRNLPPGAQVVYSAEDAGTEKGHTEGAPRAQVTKVVKYPMPLKDFAPKVRIAGMYGGGGGSDGEGGDSD
eukprot:Tamp_17080.p1 GENE.Tamp_17080~~Tamp_17080.p1  ORF type:complete len:426 (-),score=96.96 Tamp_17080:138-1415(-)